MTLRSIIYRLWTRASRAVDIIKYIARGMPLTIGKPSGIDGSEFQILTQAYKLRGRVKKLKVPVATRILVVAPHPDDETIGCGGFVLLHARIADMRLLCIYNGSAGGAIPELDGETEVEYKARLVQTRSAELNANARALNFTQTVELAVSECGDGPTEVEIAKIKNLLLEFRPELVVTPWVFDSHPHHRTANRLLATASDGINFITLGYEVWGLLPENCYIDITDVIEQKLSLVNNYVSQNSSVDYANYCEALAKVRAFHRPVRPKRRGAVEAFHMLPGWQFRQVVLGHKGIEQAGSML
jgi:N-acetylglucosamine malate deacetylase 1